MKYFLTLPVLIVSFLVTGRSLAFSQPTIHMIASFELWFLVVLFGCIDATSKCHDSHECALVDVISNATSEVECYGHYSCAQAGLIETIGSYEIQCFGSYSCYKADLIQRTTASGAGDDSISIRCDALFSCAFVDFIHNYNGTVRCRGVKSCFATKITIESSSFNDYVQCDSNQACSNSIITSHGLNIIHGYAAAQNSIFYSNSSIVTYRFRAMDSGYNATIVCGTNHTCTIDCHSNACSNLHLMCNGSDSSYNISNSVNEACFFNISCSSAEESDICPDGYKLTQTDSYPLPNVLNVTMTTYDNSIDPCYSPLTNAESCEGFRECRSDNFNNENVSICCSGYYSCLEVTNMTTLVYVNESKSNSEFVAIRCDGVFSCTGADNYIIGKNGGNLYFSGGWTSQNTGKIESTLNYDVFCNGVAACRFREIMYGNNLYCGTEACKLSPMIAYFNTVWAYTLEAAQYSTIMNIYGDVYCGSYKACQYSTISNVGGDVYGAGYVALMSATVENATKVCNTLYVSHCCYFLVVWCINILAR